VCSGRCRAKCWRQTHATQDPEIRATLEAIAQRINVVKTRVRRPGGRTITALAALTIPPSLLLRADQVIE
jgi:hypothetical protein